jgi:hypothetical protein
MSSQPPTFDSLKSPSPDQTTISQHFSSATKKAVTNPTKKMSKNGHIHHGNNTMNVEVNINGQTVINGHF